MSFLGFLLLVSALPSPPPAARSPAPAALDAAEARRRAEIYVSAIDTPISEARWRALGDPGAAALVQLAGDPQALPTRRARALAGLSAIGGPQAASFAEKLARSSQEPLTVRLQAIRTLGKLTAPTVLLEKLGPVLASDDDRRVRAAAAEVLTTRLPREGCAALKARIQREPEAAKPQFGRALRPCVAEP